MGREIRRVPPNWEHPKIKYPNHRLGVMEERYQPLHDEDFETAMQRWSANLQKWFNGEFERVRAAYPDSGYSTDEPYRGFVRGHDRSPNPDYYRPRWDADTASWFQVYETVSEGTPVTPPFATREELVDYLVQNGDLSDQKYGRGGWDRAAATSLVAQGWAPSMVLVVSKSGAKLFESRDATAELEKGEGEKSSRIECPCCGGTAATGLVEDGQPLACGCSGMISLDAETEPYAILDDEPCPPYAECRREEKGYNEDE